MARYCEELLPKLWDAQAAEAKFSEASRVIRELAGDVIDRDSIRTLTFTDRLKQRLRPSVTPA